MIPRRAPFTWVTWVTGVLSADDSCRWAAWAKSQFDYDRRPDDNAESLATWKSEHADLVEKRAAALRSDGWAVTLEGQNKFTIRGAATTLSGCPDIVATRGVDVLASDAKTGQRKGKDIWQVRIYQMALRLSKRFDGERRYIGEVVYKDGIQSVSELQIDDRNRIIDVLAEIGRRDDFPPARVPSARECAFCNIAACPERVTGEADAVETNEF